MTYAQQPRHGAPQRPPYQDHQPSYEFSQEPYHGKNGYGPRGQAAPFNGSPRRGPPQHYQKSDGPLGGSYGYDEEWLDQDYSYNGGNRGYGGRGQHSGGRWAPAQRPQGGPGQHPRNDPRSRGLPHSGSAPSGRGHYYQQDPYYQSNKYPELQNYEQHYQSEGMYHNGSHEYDKGEDEYDEFSVETPDNGRPMQHYNRPSHSNDRAFQDPEYNGGHPQQDRGGPYDRGAPPGNYRNDRPSRQSEAAASRFNQDQPNFIRPQDSQHPKPRKSAKA